MRTVVLALLAGLALWPLQVLAEPLELAGLTVKSGFEEAEVHEEARAEQPHWGKAVVRSWSVRGEKGVFWRVVEVSPDKPAKTLSGYLARWRAVHGCTAKEVKDLPPTARDGKPLKQLTFEGSCKGGDLYLIRVIVVDGRAYELHVDTRAGLPRVDLRAELKSLLSRIVLERPSAGE